MEPKEVTRVDDYDFDELINRRGTSSAKWDWYGERDILPLWVADMDFRSPPAVIEALHARVTHGVFGYTFPPKELATVVCQMLAEEYSWQIEEEWIVWLPGLVSGLNISCRVAGMVGDAVLSTVPVYPPFLSAPKNSERELLTVPLVLDRDRWVIDFEALEQAITPRARMFLLCSPYNPVGRVFTENELCTVAALCEKYDLLICSDEIHCQLILDDDKRHIPTATLDPAIAARTITLLAPSKTYNLAGLGCSFAVISDKTLRERFVAAKAGIVPHVNVLAYVAALAAYRDSHEWRQALLAYLRGNRDIVTEGIRQAPALSMTHVEATYLAWIDARSLGIAKPGAFFEQARVGLWDGDDFAGPGFVRLNFACPAAVLKEGLSRIHDAVKHL
jgi:cystathionine beta-lyase